MIIDFHVHIFPPEMISERTRFFDDRRFSALYSDEKSKIIGQRELSEMMAREGISRAVAMAFPFENDEYRELQNEYLLESSRKSGGTIIPFLAAPEKIAHLEKWAVNAKKSGAAGIGEVAFYSSGFGEKEKEYLQALLRVASIAGLPVCLHVNEPVGHRYPGKYPTSFELLYEVIAQNKHTNIILAHWGGGLFFYELMKEVRANFSHVMYDTAATPYLYDEKIYRVARDIVGPEKILFGSDFPLLAPSRYLTPIRASFEKDACSAVLFENARTLLERK